MKKIIMALSVIISLVALSFGSAILSGTSFFECTFLVGLISTLIIYVFTNNNQKIHVPTIGLRPIVGIKALETTQEERELMGKIRMNFPLFVSGIYTIISLVITVGLYWHKF